MSGNRDPHSLQPAQQLSRDPPFPVGPAYPPCNLAQLCRNNATRSPRQHMGHNPVLYTWPRSGGPEDMESRCKAASILTE